VVNGDIGTNANVNCGSLSSSLVVAESRLTVKDISVPSNNGLIVRLTAVTGVANTNEANSKLTVDKFGRLFLGSLTNTVHANIALITSVVEEDQIPPVVGENRNVIAAKSYNNQSVMALGFRRSETDPNVVVSGVLSAYNAETNARHDIQMNCANLWINASAGLRPYSNLVVNIGAVDAPFGNVYARSLETVKGVKCNSLTLEKGDSAGQILNFKYANTTVSSELTRTSSGSSFQPTRYIKAALDLGDGNGLSNVWLLVYNEQV